MQTFNFKVELEVSIEAFEFSDALEIVEDYFSDELGELRIRKSTITHK